MSNRSEHTANEQLSQTKQEQDLMNERKPLQFEEEKPQGNPNDSSTWEIV